MYTEVYSSLEYEVPEKKRKKKQKFLPKLI